LLVRPGADPKTLAGPARAFLLKFLVRAADLDIEKIGFNATAEW
jgi:hypothetical protein